MIEINKIHKMDCLKGLKEIPDLFADLVLTDPPYGIGAAKNGTIGGNGGFKKGNKRSNHVVKVKDYGKQEWDLNHVDKPYFDEMFRVSKNQIIFGGNYYIDYLYNSSCWIIWDKDNSGNFADCEMAWTSFNTAVRRIKHRWNGMLQEDMKNKEKRYHPTQKPLRVMEWIIRNYTKEGELVLDPFAGSGTTLVACKRLNRNYIGFELSDEYVRVCNKRLYNVPVRLEKFQT